MNRGVIFLHLTLLTDISHLSLFLYKKLDLLFCSLNKSCPLLFRSTRVALGNLDYFCVFMFSCFRVFVRPLFFLLVSLMFLLILKSFNGVSRQFKECLKFNGSFKAVLRKF